MPSAAGSRTFVPCRRPQRSPMAPGRRRPPGRPARCRLPARRSLIPAGRQVIYDVASAATVPCVEVRGTLTFDTQRNTRLKVVTLMVMDEGVLEVGTEDRPIAAGVRAEIQIADRRFDDGLDPGQVGNGIIGLGRIRMHGAIKTPTFARLAGDARAARRRRARAAGGRWAAAIGSSSRIPGSCARPSAGAPSSRATSRSKSRRSSGATVTVRPALAWDHPGARRATAAPSLRPHVGNLSRNVVVASERAGGTRGHMIFLARADVDIRYVEVQRHGPDGDRAIDSTTFDAAGQRALRSARTRSAATRSISTTTSARSRDAGATAISSR